MELTGLRTTAAAVPAAARRGWSELRFAPPPPQEQQGRRGRPGVRKVVAAISEEVPRLASSSPGVKGGGERRPAPEKVALRAALTVRRKQKEDIKDAVAGHLDALWDMVGRNVVLELISTKIHPRTKKPMQSGRVSIKDWCQKRGAKGDHVVYTAEFTVDADFGEPGAIAVSNRHNREFFLESIVVEGGLPSGPVHFACNSWVQSTRELPTKRVFFSNKPYLPSETPPGLRELREKELKDLRGDGTGVRKLSDRIYDYATYNDLGNPDKGKEFIRPILGGEKIPYPRRCRTGRPPTDTNMLAESRVEKPHPIYVPRDEAFEELKQGAFSSGRLRAVLHTLIPSLIASISAETHNFQGFHHIDNLYKEGLRLKLGLQEHLFQKIPLVQKIQESSEGMLRYDTPSILSKDKFAWLRDDEFARQAVAGINPVNIERLQVFPPVSKLDPAIYGPPESSITEKHIAGHLNGLTAQQAMDEAKLFIMDYHDVYLPFLDRINAIEGRKAYATRTIFFLTEAGTLKPIAIELSLPPTQPGEPGPSKVLTPPCDATTNWLWMLAKSHVSSNDAGVHQLVNHWLRTHATMEPFILAAHRHMSAMHPIFKLLHPHMRYTLEINALARQSLINADGVIESCFTPGPVSGEISAAYYRNHWRFDLEGLPSDLIRRGVAVEDATQPHGVRLLIEDYPYANDGLLLWSAIRNWVESYVQLYYPDAGTVQGDLELQGWYHESVHVGHGDLRDAPWWPPLSTPADLASILMTLVWLASAQHAALNFGQYPLGGYVPNRPPLMRRLLPDLERDAAEYAAFLADPHRFFLNAMPGVLEATKFMAVVDTLSTHSPDEEYLGEGRDEGGVPWTADEAAVAAHAMFSADVRRAEEAIERRNADHSRKNRCGAGVLPYELLAPSSPPGVTCRGVPNSISI
ncbi:probable lipoxygenase 6 isoform X1 [Oryza brachyantha]|uniref:probable lipoxygenase 6 isoform X1 n=2 Tax=Oryza brachyantha TaxID=4533 RepID=UPI001ADCBD40|nr:probable lipoxygenase 6 isoform X1 [Oryza brachyantha]